MRAYTGPPATLGTTLAAGLDLIGDYCTACRRSVHVDIAALRALAARYGGHVPLPDVMARLTCKDCGGRVDARVHVPGLATFGASMGRL